MRATFHMAVALAGTKALDDLDAQSEPNVYSPDCTIHMITQERSFTWRGRR